MKLLRRIHQAHPIDHGDGGLHASGILITCAIKQVEFAIAYAIWAGLGVLLTTVIGVYFFQESLTPMKAISAAMIIAGVLGFYLSQPAHS